MATYGLKIALDGKEATSQNPNDFVFLTGINTLKILREYAGSIEVTDETIEIDTITHNLGYKPMVFGYFQHPDALTWHLMPSTAGINAGADYGIISNLVNVSDNETEVRLYAEVFASPDSPSLTNYRVFMLADPATGAWFGDGVQSTNKEAIASDYSLKVARNGFDALTAEPKDMVFDSDLDTFAILQTFYYEADNDRTTVAPDVRSNRLGKSTAFFAYIKDFDGFWQPTNQGYLSGGASPFYVDDDNVYYNDAQEGFIILTNSIL